MSTITVVKKNGIAAIAADSLTKWGPIKETAEYVVNHEKIMQVGDYYLAVVGPAAAMPVLKHFFAARRRPVRLDDPDEIFALWLEMHGALKEQYFLIPEEEDGEDFAYESSRMDVLIAGPRGIFGVGADRAVQEYSRFYAYGFGGQYALGAMYAAYDDPGKPAEEIARLGVQAAAEFDDGTALPVASYAVKLSQPGPGPRGVASTKK